MGRFNPGRELSDKEKLLLSLYRDLNDFGQIALQVELNRLLNYPFYSAYALKIEPPKNDDKPNKK